MLTVEEWRPFLEEWSAEWLSTDEEFPDAVRRLGWLGADPATLKQIARLERRLGFALPPSYRAFLLTTNGWRKTTFCIRRLRPLEKVQWLSVEDPDAVEAWNVADYDDDDPFMAPDEYFAYDQRPIFNARHLEFCLVIGDPIPGDSATYLLNPAIVTEDGEWEAWFLAHWVPGAERFPSFAHLMRHEYESFRMVNLKDQSQTLTFGPFEGIYAPEAPRHAAPRIGPGKLRPPRKTTWELIELLEDPSEKVRRHAARRLLRHFKPHQAENEQPEWVPHLVRILDSDLESEVRQAAACMLGSYGDDAAIAPLIRGLQDRVVSRRALDALFYLGIDIKDTRIADAMCDLLRSSKDEQQLDRAVSILWDQKDPRLGPLGLEILDNATDQRMQQLGAWAVTRAPDDWTDELIARLKHDNPGIRAQAAWGLGLLENPHSIEPLRAALNDRDPEVRRLAAASLQRMGE